MPAKQNLPIFIFCFLSTFFGIAQEKEDFRLFKTIAGHDLSFLWRGDSIRPEHGEEKLRPREPLGYIGPNYQRFYIHYSSVVKSPKDPYLYHVAGKTRVKNNICSFKGTIRITSTKPVPDELVFHVTPGTLIADVNLQEDNSQKGSGTIKGTLTTDFYIDEKGRPQYNALLFQADSYCNNQCTATWTSYSTHQSKKCVWGDYRMPDSKELDQGVGDVSISEKFLPFGWQSYMDSFYGNLEAEKLEAINWWK